MLPYHQGHITESNARVETTRETQLLTIRWMAALMQNPESVSVSFSARRTTQYKKDNYDQQTPESIAATTPEAIEKAAAADPDAQPLNEGEVRRMKRTLQTKIIRRALELTQKEFSIRFRILLGTLRDWEQGRAEPDQPSRAYLTVIARDPEHVNRMLNPRGRP